MKPWKAPAAGSVSAAQPVRVRSSSLTRSAAPQSNGGIVTPDSPRSDIVVKSRRPSGGISSSNDEQVLNSLILGLFHSVFYDSVIGFLTFLVSASRAVTGGGSIGECGSVFISTLFF